MKLSFWARLRQLEAWLGNNLNLNTYYSNHPEADFTGL